MTSGLIGMAEECGPGDDMSTDMDDYVRRAADATLSNQQLVQ